MKKEMIAMMTAQEFIELISSSYRPDEMIVGRVVGKADVEDAHPLSITNGEWLDIADLFEEALDSSVINDLDEAIEAVLGVE